MLGVAVVPGGTPAADPDADVEMLEDHTDTFLYLDTKDSGRGLYVDDMPCMHLLA